MFSQNYCSQAKTRLLKNLTLHTFVFPLVCTYVLLLSQVLYRMFEGFVTIERQNPPIMAVDVFAGIGSFFVVSLGGILIGLIFAVITALSTKLVSGEYWKTLIEQPFRVEEGKPSDQFSSE